MNRKTIIIIIITAVCICTVAIWLLTLYHKSDMNIPILSEYQLKYGIPPSYIKEKLGEAIKVIPNVCDTNQTAYEYNAEILNHKANMTCYFIEDQELIRVNIEWTLDSIDMAKELCSEAEAILVEAYSSENDYFYNRDKNSDGDTYSVSLGKNNGATGIFYEIAGEENTLIISCFNNK